MCCVVDFVFCDRQMYQGLNRGKVFKVTTYTPSNWFYNRCSLTLQSTEYHYLVELAYGFPNVCDMLLAHKGVSRQFDI